MERTLSVEEKIKRAEEIYNKRRNPGAKIEADTINVIPSSFVIRKMKKLFIKVSICVILYVVLYSTDFGSVFFSQNISNDIKDALSTDIDFGAIYNSLNAYIQSIINHDEINENLNNVQENSIPIEENNLINTENVIQNNIVENVIQDDSINEKEIQSEKIDENNTSELNIIQNVDEMKNEEVNIGGAIEVEDNSQVFTAEQKTQMEIDAEYVLSKIKFEKPLRDDYQISSRYGIRNPTTSTVPKNHKGIDLAALTGTKITSATDGTVVLASSEGDYGNHLKIQIDDVIIVYAHCNKLYVQEGDIVSIGQEIGEVGSTRKFYRTAFTPWSKSEWWLCQSGKRVAEYTDKIESLEP